MVAHLITSQITCNLSPFAVSTDSQRTVREAFADVLRRLPLSPLYRKKTFKEHALSESDLAL